MRPRHPLVVDAVRRNCGIADARHAHEATLCTYLLQMRELYCWERGLPSGAQPARADVSRWIADREAAWQSLENEDYVALPLPSRPYDPFDAAAINQELLADGLVYGAGLGRFRRPHFFLAELERIELRGDTRVIVTGLEIARDLTAVPAALQGNTIHVRREALRRWLWERVEFWRSRRTAGALARAIESWGLAAGDEAAFERMVAAETETLILHEIGESRAGAMLGNGKRLVVAGQKSGMVHAIDPDQGGELVWSTRVGIGGTMGGVQWGSAADANNIYVANSDILRVMLPFANNTDADPKRGGGMYALRLDTGKQVWFTPPVGCGEKKRCSPAQSQAVTAIPGVAFSGSVDGHLRAYDAANGKVVWDVDTAIDYKTANGVTAHGGSLDGAGPVIGGGMLYVNSGYSSAGGMPGNVLLAFSVDGK